MKKIAMMCVMVLAGSAVYAQSPSVECRICSDMLSGWSKLKQADSAKKAQAHKADSIDLAVRRAAVKHAREATEAAKKADSTKDNKAAAYSYPTYLYGREGHMMALGDVMAQKAAARKAVVKVKPTEGQKTAEAVRKQKDATWLKAIFLGARYPGESEEQYKMRQQVQTTAAGQPFK